MTILAIEDFRLGMDTRKSILTAAPGSLRVLDNCIITPGGEIEKRKAFVKVATLAAGTTKGLYGTATGGTQTEQLYVFALGTGANTQIASIGYIPVIKHLLQTVGGTEGLRNVQSVLEYGPQQLFAVGVTEDTPGGTQRLRNWWTGLTVANYTGYAPLVVGQKTYRVSGPTLYFAGVGDPSATNPLNPAGTGPNTVNPGAGFIDTSRIDSDSQFLVGMEAYYKQVALFSRRTCLLFSLDPDLANNTFVQLIRIGAVSNGSILQFGTGDVLFLSDSGVRSLRALNASLAAGVTDVGSPIDRDIQAAIAAVGDDTAFYSEAIVDPITGRYWLALGNTIYVLSYWPSAKINAWSTFTLPFTIDHMAVAGTKIFLRSGDDIYQYGGTNGTTYDNSVATVRTPHMDAGSPTTFKKPMNIDVSCSGNWAVSVGMQTDNPNLYELAANITGVTYSMQKLPFAGNGTHIGFTLTTSDASAATLGAINVSFQKTVEK